MRPAPCVNRCRTAAPTACCAPAPFPFIGGSKVTSGTAIFFAGELRHAAGQHRPYRSRPACPTPAGQIKVVFLFIAEPRPTPKATLQRNAVSWFHRRWALRTTSDELDAPLASPDRPLNMGLTACSPLRNDRLPGNRASKVWPSEVCLHRCVWQSVQDSLLNGSEGA